MRFFRILLFFGLVAILSGGCHQYDARFGAFEFSYNDVFESCYSIRFTDGDTVFIRQHFASAGLDMAKSNTAYFGVLTKEDRARLDSFMQVTRFSTFDSAYFQPAQDGLDYQFYFAKDSVSRLIRVSGDSVPEQLVALQDWIARMKKGLLLHKISDTLADFRSLHHFLSPDVSETILKFTPPKIK